MCGIRTSSRTRSGVRLAHEWEHLRPGLRLSDDLEATVGLERTLDPVEDEPVVVGNHDAHVESVSHRAPTPPQPHPTAPLRGPPTGVASSA